MTRKELELNKALEQEHEQEQKQVQKELEQRKSNNYMIVTSYDIMELEDKVSILLDRGWVVSGGVALTEYGLAQAMVRGKDKVDAFISEARKVKELVSRV